MSSQFDELSKALARGMPRRTAVRLFAASLLGSAIPWARLGARTAHAGIAVCNPPCAPGQQCIHLNNRGVCIGGGVVCHPPCAPGQICIVGNGNNGICVRGPCFPACLPGEMCVTFNGGKSLCISPHCDPPCTGDEICVRVSVNRTVGRGIYVCRHRP